MALDKEDCEHADGPMNSQARRMAIKDGQAVTRTFKDTLP